MPSSAPSPTLPILIGTSSNVTGANRGIYATQLDPASGALTPPELAFETPNPGFLCRHPNGPWIYASGENGMATPKAAGGAVCAFGYDPAGRRLAFLNKQPTGGLSVTHLIADRTGRALLAASYHGGQIAAFPIAPDGTVGARSAWMLPAGALGPKSARQDKPHPHSVTLSPDNRFLYVCDLGLDKIFCYRLDATSAALTPAGEFVAAAGAGPRHSKFSADGCFFYVINELACTITTYACDPATGALAARQTVPTLPDGFAGESICSEIRLHPNGLFVYGANRGCDSIAVFQRDPAEGLLTRIEIVPSGGAHPRNFALSDDGAWLVCANRDTNGLASFRVDPGTGRLTPAGLATGVPFPSCVLFMGSS